MRKILFFIVCLFYTIGNFAQTKIEGIGTNAPNQQVIISDQNNNDENELTKLIIEFKDQPSIKFQNSLRKSTKYNMPTSQFANDLKRISERFKNNQNQVSLQNIAINKEFYKVFSGVQIDVPKKYIQYISALSYVKKIHMDHEIKANLDQSISIINADKIWNNLNNKGEGIKISIIDTGIDYMHDALGHGYGLGYKVIDGYDFVNHDNDPMDDNGHGTHVAGIVAANSTTLKGVAPDALLIACKILDAKGSGYSSSIIEAIEYSIDPNNDDDYSDAADVINLSLGGSGTPDDPISQSVNNASDIGIIVCVAAGNDGGMGFHTINSPACAEKAITVGNSTKSKSLASNSSKGPNTIDFSIKPDILAPGADIKSVKLLGGTITYSGTSMATPHIAGICALIKKQHPNWTPVEIKSALKTTAEKLNYGPMEQGSGFVNAYNAIDTKTFAIPSDLSFGICDTTNTFWTPNKILKIKNISTDLQQYTVNISSSTMGIDFTIDKPTFSIQAGDSTEIKIGMSVNNSLVDFRNSGSNSYGGYFQITGTHDTLSLPWAFVKRQMIELKFECPNAKFNLASDGKNFADWSATWPDLYTARLNVPNGNYDFLSYMISNDTIFFNIKTGLNISGVNVITTSKKESKNEIHIDGKDEYGNKIIELSDSYFSLILYNKRKSAHLVNIYKDKPYKCFVPDIPENILLHCHQYNIEDGKAYRVIVHEPVTNAVSDIYLTNSSADLVKRKVKFIYDKNVITPAISFIITAQFKNNNGLTMTYIDLGLRTNLGNNYWDGYVIMNKIESINPSFDFELKAHNTYPPAGWSYSFITAPFRVENTNLFTSYFDEITPDIFIESDTSNHIIFGDDIFFGQSTYTVSSNYFEQGVNFLGQMKDSRTNGGNKYKYKVYNSSNQLIKSGETEIVDKFDYSGSNLYKTEYYQTDHSRFTDTSLAMLTSIIRNNSSDRTPPSITSFQIRNSTGRPIDEISAEDKIEIRFSLKDPNLNETSAKIEVSEYPSANWIQCETVKISEHEKIGSLFAATLDSAIFKNIKLLSVKISGEDNNSNYCEWFLNPAIKINKGNYYQPQFTSIGNQTINEDDSLSVDFICTDKDDDALNYQASSNIQGFKMNITGSTLKIVPPPNWFGTEEIFLTVSDGKYSNSTKFTLEVIPVNDRPGKFSLLYPKNESQIEINNSNEKDSLDFVWTKSIDVDGDSVKYLLYFNMETAKVESTVTFNNVFTYSYPDLLKYFADKKYLSLTWSVFVTDGVDTIYADNSSFVLKLSNNIVGIDENVLPTKYYLYNAFPNPFNPATMIEYDIPELSQVELQVYDLLGRLIKTVVNEEKPAGRYSVRFDGGELSSGIYFYKLQAGPFLQIKKFVLLK